MSNNDRFYKASEVINMRFVKIPKTILYNERYEKLSSSEILAYGILQDRFELSIKNGWVDENDSIYMVYDREQLGKILRVDRRTASNYVKKLEKVGLLVDKRMGQGKTNRIYMLKPVADKEYLYDVVKEERNVEDAMMSENMTSRSHENVHLEVRKSDSSDTEFKDTEFKDTQSIKEERLKDDGLIEILNKCDLDSLDIKDKAITDQAIKVLYNRKTPINSNGVSVNSVAIKGNMKQLEHKHIVQALKDLEKSSDERELTNPIAYLSTCIYNAIFTTDIKTKAIEQNNTNLKGHAVKKVRTGFHNFKQRTDDYTADELERMVLRKRPRMN